MCWLLVRTPTTAELLVFVSVWLLRSSQGLVCCIIGGGYGAVSWASIFFMRSSSFSLVNFSRKRSVRMGKEKGLNCSMSLITMVCCSMRCRASIMRTCSIWKVITSSNACWRRRLSFS